MPLQMRLDTGLAGPMNPNTRTGAALASTRRAHSEHTASACPVILASFLLPAGRDGDNGHGGAYWCQHYCHQLR